MADKLAHSYGDVGNLKASLPQCGSPLMPPPVLLGQFVPIYHSFQPWCSGAPWPRLK